jgi:hypothetical protein
MRRPAVIVALAVMLGAFPASARIVQIRIDRVEPFADGAMSGNSGAAYQRVIGVAKGEPDLVDPHNAGIADISRITSRWWRRPPGNWSASVCC